MRKTLSTATLVIAALAVASGTAHAADPPVHFTATQHDDSATISVDSGALVVKDGTFEITGPGNTVLAGTPLHFRVDDFEFPISADIHGNTATLTPHFDARHARYAPVAMPYEDQAPWKTPYDREQAAWSRLTTTIAMGSTVGTAVGGLGGAAVGCVLGGIAGATVAAATIVGMFGPFVPAAVIGCLGGTVAMAPLGTVAGLLLVTAPVAIAAAAQYFTTTNQPFPGR
ncbi:hypothetical protein NONO_c31480 [Nocardia nova SH22a]|uniref:DUF8020 domain-containing protein n=1 Tax=Nocardia nova SH22a TaxID=1415166 RepID=W5TF40_9NOCA|nr:hypothetical protein [Nocardia nova]AHH17935.1 hypothetical protein NONO_c31480 [Nocardia nova SH22a]